MYILINMYIQKLPSALLVRPDEEEDLDLKAFEDEEEEEHTHTHTHTHTLIVRMRVHTPHVYSNKYIHTETPFCTSCATR